MKTSYWKKRWKDDDIDFHQSKANALLTRHIQQLGLEQGSRIFLPLCGKTLDIAWLLSKGYRVAGSELSEKAIQQLFEELSVEPKVSKTGKLKQYRATNIDILVGDFFDISADLLGTVNAIYDRAALVALPKKMRQQYTTHLTTITHTAPQLLLCYEYNQANMKGPPFSVDSEEVHKRYGRAYQLTLVENLPVEGGLKGRCEAEQKVWLLQNH